MWAVSLVGTKCVTLVLRVLKRKHNCGKIPTGGFFGGGNRTTAYAIAIRHKKHFGVGWT